MPCYILYNTFMDLIQQHFKQQLTSTYKMHRTAYVYKLRTAINIASKIRILQPFMFNGNHSLVLVICFFTKKQIATTLQNHPYMKNKMYHIDADTYLKYLCSLEGFILRCRIDIPQAYLRIIRTTE